MMDIFLLLLLIIVFVTCTSFLRKKSLDPVSNHNFFGNTCAWGDEIDHFLVAIVHEGKKYLKCTGNDPIFINNSKINPLISLILNVYQYHYLTTKEEKI